MQTDTADAIASRNKQKSGQVPHKHLSRKFQETKGDKNALQSKMPTDTADATN